MLPSQVCYLQGGLQDSQVYPGLKRSGSGNIGKKGKKGNRGAMGNQGNFENRSDRGKRDIIRKRENI